MEENGDVKISVLIPGFKSQYLEEAIKSVLIQSYNNFELIIVDDHSPEDLHAIVSKFNDERLFYYRNDKNYGAKNVVLNWNRCLSYATGEYVICMGDDDKLASNCLELYYKKIKENPSINVFHIQTLLIDENSELYAVQESRPEWESVYSAAYYKLSGRFQYIGDWLFRTSALKSIGGFFYLPYAWYSDDITPLIVGKMNGIININEFGFLYRVSRQTISSNTDNIEGKIDATIRAYEWFEKFISNEVHCVRDKIFCNRAVEILPMAKLKDIEILVTSVMKSYLFKGIRLFIRYRRKNILTCGSLVRCIIKSFYK